MARVYQNTIPCELCKYSKSVTSGGFVLTYCEKKKEIICDLQWINVFSCWRYCQCSPLSSSGCKYFEPHNTEEYRRMMSMVEKQLGSIDK